MLTQDWGFDYIDTKLANATDKKKAFHQERPDCWEAKPMAAICNTLSKGA